MGLSNTYLLCHKNGTSHPSGNETKSFTFTVHSHLSNAGNRSTERRTQNRHVNLTGTDLARSAKSFPRYIIISQLSHILCLSSGPDLNFSESILKGVPWSFAQSWASLLRAMTSGGLLSQVARAYTHEPSRIRKTLSSAHEEPWTVLVARASNKRQANGGLLSQRRTHAHRPDSLEIPSNVVSKASTNPKEIRIGKWHAHAVRRRYHGRPD